MKLVCSRWISFSEDTKESWRSRAVYLNSRQIPGQFLVLPSILNSNLVDAVLESLTGEWYRICKVFGGVMKRQNKVLNVDLDGTSKCFGKERAMVRNEVVRTILASLMVVDIFGVDGSCFRGDEIVEKTLNIIVAHIASLNRMIDIFIMNSLCACKCEWKRMSYSYGSKVSLERNGRESLGYAMEKEGDNWSVTVRAEKERIRVTKVTYDRFTVKYVFPCDPSCEYKVKQYWPIWMFIRRNKCVYIANILVYNIGDGLFQNVNYT